MKYLVSSLIVIAIAFGVYYLNPAEDVESNIKQQGSTSSEIAQSNDYTSSQNVETINKPHESNNLTIQEPNTESPSVNAQVSTGRDETDKGYKLLAPEESNAIFQEHLNAEFCLSYMGLIARYGSLKNAAIEKENLYETPTSETFEMYRGAEEKCVSYKALSEEALLKEIDDLLIEAIELGSEVAEFKYGTYLFQRSLYGTDFYTKKQREEQVTKAIQIFEKYIEKGHVGSMASAARIFMDGINYPDTYDLDRGNFLMSKLQEVSGP